MEITLYRDQPIQRETRALPATTYNLAHALLARSPHGSVFVPIRAMQYLAILERDEFVFVDSQYKDYVEIAWQQFRPQARAGLEDPVPYEALAYHPDGIRNQARLLAEFTKALQLLALKERPEGPAKLLKFDRKKPVE
jgi:hypothetical protein